METALLILSVLFIGLSTFGLLVKITSYLTFIQLIVSFFIGTLLLLLSYREEVSKTDKKR